MKKLFGSLPGGEQVTVYTISCGKLTAEILDLGATLHRLYVPDARGNVADVVLGFDSPAGYLESDGCFGAVVGRNANRIKNGRFTVGGREYSLALNNGNHSNHSGPDYYKDRLWNVEQVDGSSIRLKLFSPDGDQGFPGNATIHVTYSVEPEGVLRVCYDAECDKDTIFNLTNHSFFNLAGHDKPELAMDQTLCLPARHYTVVDEESIPTGALAAVAGTAMDFRSPKALKEDLAALPGGYDHNFEVFTEPCAILADPVSGRTMAVYTDCPGIHVYSGNYLSGEQGKDGVRYCRRGGVALETQFYPDAIHHPQWRSPILSAGGRYRSETRYIFK